MTFAHPIPALASMSARRALDGCIQFKALELTSIAQRASLAGWARQANGVVLLMCVDVALGVRVDCLAHLGITKLVDPRQFRIPANSALEVGQVW